MQNRKDSSDPLLWLEDIEGERALAWVRAQNQRTLDLLQADPRYPRFHETALTIATSKARIPFGSIRNGYVYNFWQDEDHERGVWRRVKLVDYEKPEPPWEVLLDIDALATRENANWVYKGVSSLPPENRLCLVSLSDGGKDAVRIREFDIDKKDFVPGGFDIPEAKSDVIFESEDSLLIATDWGEGTLTESGYPFVVKRLRRGQKPSDAVELFHGTKEDVATSPFELEDATGNRWFGACRAETFFTASYYLFRENQDAVKIPIPPKATPKGLFAGEFLFTLEQDWTPEGQQAFTTGDLAHFNWGEFTGVECIGAEFTGAGKLPRVELMMRPDAKQAIQAIGLSKDAVLVTLSDNVALKVVRCVKSTDGWSTSNVALPSKGAGEVSFADVTERETFLTFEGFLDPDTLYQYDPDEAVLKQIKAMPAWFDAAPYQVGQYEATSRDGTHVPYFIVHRKDLPLDGSNPTLMYGYGGFQVSQTPYYSGVIGKLWLEQGGVFVLANIRGGGEFGPAWHQAGLKLKRQTVYDDFIAIAEDLIARKITRKEKLGAMGGSNGGLLMGVMFTQRPELFKAIVCQVPLLDMLRYHLLLAGASWMDEYGDPDVPEERACLEKLSPYHNVDPGKTYPEIYFETSTKDDRVHPGHARKMARRLEELGKPFLYYENIDGGHSAAANQREAARRAALEYTYLARQLVD